MPAAVGVALLAIGPSAAADPTDGTLPTTSAPLFRIADSRIDEASGIVVGRASPGVVYVQNDSGDSARFFALDTATGQTVAACTVPGAENVDWEDMAGGTAADGTPALWLADIGDNDAERDTVTIYQVREPVLTPTQRNARCTAVVTRTWTLKYPDGAHDAESVLFDPASRRLYVATKSFLGATVFYLVPAIPDGTQTMETVGRVQLRVTDASGGPLGRAGGLLATGGAFSDDGSVLVLRTYTSAWFWRVGADGPAAALRQEPSVIDLPDQDQGEGIDVLATGPPGGAQPVSVVLDSEGRQSEVLRVALALPADARPSPATASASGGAAASPAPPASSVPAASENTGNPYRHRAEQLVIGVGILAGVVVLVVTFTVGRRQRR